jgi:hypothetical protein
VEIAGLPSNPRNQKSSNDGTTRPALVFTTSVSVPENSCNRRRHKNVGTGYDLGNSWDFIPVVFLKSIKKGYIL